MVTAGYQVESADPGVGGVGVRKPIAKRQGVFVIQLVVDARGRASEPSWRGDHGGKRTNRKVRVDPNSVCDGPVVDHVALRIKIKRGSLADRPAAIAFEFVEQERRLL